MCLKRWAIRRVIKMVKKIVNGSLYGKRKVLSAWGLTILLTLILFGSWLIPKVPNFESTYENLITLIWLSYFSANAICKFAGKKNGK
jgi:hypothetical protein